MPQFSATAVADHPAVESLCEGFLAKRVAFEADLPIMYHFARHSMLSPEIARRWNCMIRFDAELPSDSPWRAFIAALATDGDAELPE